MGTLSSGVQFSCYPSFCHIWAQHFGFKPSKKNKVVISCHMLDPWIIGSEWQCTLHVTFSTVTNISTTNTLPTEVQMEYGLNIGVFYNCRIEGLLPSLLSMFLEVGFMYQVIGVSMFMWIIPLQRFKQTSGKSKYFTSKDFYITGDASLGNLGNWSCSSELFLLIGNGKTYKACQEIFLVI